MPATGQMRFSGPTTVDPIRTICSRTSSGDMPGSCTRRLSASAPTSRMVPRAARATSSGSSDAIVWSSPNERRVGGVALVDGPLAVDEPGLHADPARPDGSGPWSPSPRPRRRPRSGGPSLSGGDIPSMRIPAPHRAARTAAATDTAALSTGTGACSAGEQRRVPFEVAQAPRPGAWRRAEEAPI